MIIDLRAEREKRETELQRMQRHTADVERAIDRVKAITQSPAMRELERVAADLNHARAEG